MALEGWSEFNVAMAGAAAALAGLLIVALSVNVAKIIQYATLPARAAASVSALVLVVLTCGVALIPGQTLQLIGLELVLPTAVCVLLAVVAVRRIFTEADVKEGNRIIKTVTVALAPIGFAVGVALLLVDVGAGYTVLAFSGLLAICAAVLFSWVALVEVLR